MSAPDFDLQAHSTRSDGSLEPGAVVAAAAEAGVQLLALTDHDTVDGVEEALAAGGEHSVEVVPAIEVSAVQSGAAADVHVLGYRIDHGSPELSTALEGWQADRALRFERYLVAGAPAFVPRSTPSVAEAIAAIHTAGGVAVWAHPFWDVSDPSEVLATLARFAALGLDGVEVFYATHTEEQVALLAARGTRDGLLQT